MVKKEKIIPAGKFKAGCLAILDEVARTKEPVVVTKRGQPVARLVPLEGPPPKAEVDVFARARAAAGSFEDPQGARDVSARHDRYLAGAMRRKR
ncbi:MAG: type II toxin-antitoxin system Phd/YefM family antitoxin [Myxococcales bacterium]|nr:type II toxin-antitoxin system Phd/YefM family antitoxin [Myxococcales bacterium]